MPTTLMGLDIINSSDPVSPDPINGNMEKLDKLGTDYVTQVGTSGAWNFRKWKSGRFEATAWLKQQNSSPDIQVDESTGMRAFQLPYPVTFGSYPSVFVGCKQDGNPKVHVCYQEESTEAASWYLGGMDWGKGADVICWVSVIGQV